MKRITFAAALVFLTAAQAAQGSACPQHFPSPPAVTRDALSPKLRELCYESFAVLHSGLSRTPLVVGSHLTRASVESAESVDREGEFYPESRLPADERSELNDYRRSGYDRGHLYEAAAAPTRTSQLETFSLANIVPQNSVHNRGLWAWIEAEARRLAKRIGDVYVITGVLFEGRQLNQVGGRVLVPTSLYKAVYDPTGKRGAAYLSPNSDDASYEVLSLTDLEKRAGVRFLPSGSSKDVKMLDLPEPRRFQRSYR